VSRAAAKRRGLPETVRMRHGSHFVDELTSRSGSDETVGRIVPLSQIEPDPKQPRTTMGELGDLVSSIRSKGVLEPLLVRPGERSGRYLIISGERRYRAAMQAGLVEVPVIEMEVTPEEALEIALIENLQRKDLTPFEEAEGYRSLAETFDYTHESIAEAVGKSRTVITESLSLLQMSQRVREAAQALGIQSKSLLLEVLKCESEEEMIHLLEEVARRGLSRDDLRRQKRGEKGGQKPARRKPYVFNFKPSDKSFRLSLKFRQHEVSKDELIQALQQVLEDLRAS